MIVPDEYMETDVLLGADLIGTAPFSWNGKINEIQWSTAKFKVNEGHKCRIWGVSVTKQTEVIDAKAFVQANKRSVLKLGEYIAV